MRWFSKSVRVFYSHPMKLYGSNAEKREIALIQKTFERCELVNPSQHPPGPDAGSEVEHYLSLVDTCDTLVFSRHFGYITEGVKPEVDHALAKRMKVFEIREGKLIEVTGPIANLPIGKRLILRAKGAFGSR